ncbi:phospholipase D family protein [Pollutimonas bauzanensis]|uniref:Phosphatidylserine/phosphatidylglycerophosphate/cardiolipin synthase n=1 Tax=Pollutimonas bauzanensis TaxID=658167 RepID=A0A1M5ZMJ5_9BURK|nr:phospholipase D family protein [Pollutimonas bauzanensis]SHI25401.1 Phosphatidylserine/phosphatidylglycerophosphate/cardiolipin synthase [Pollutimonas bauzanensis]
MKIRIHAALCMLLICLGAVAISGCAALPSLADRTASQALTDDESKATTLGKAISRMAGAHPGKSGVHSLADPQEAFAVRALLARAAEKTLDVQYYIWHDDLTGSLLFEALHAAADRGVRVRLLLDDNNTSGLDGTLAALDSHPNIEVRLFNPFVIRSPRWLGYITDFSRANRRMHNKSFTADNRITIIGGRNVGDEYFGATDGVLFADLDVAAVGPVVKDVSDDFDRYWNSQSSYPASLLLPPAEPGRLAKLKAEGSVLERDPRAAAYVKALRDSSLIRQLADQTIELEWATTHMVSDDPRKGLGQVPPEQLLTHDLEQIIGKPKSDVELVSPYFVPSAAGVAGLTAMTRRGVTLKILTNSLDATDVAAVHAGYAKRRKPLLEAGVKLYEMKRLSPGTRRNKSAGPFGSSGSSLHAKTFSVDSSRIFIGSFNFDPRSAKLNTELGFIIDSPAMARRINAAFNDRIPEIAYEVRLSDSGALYWTEQRDGRQIRYDTEPHASLWRRASVDFLSLLPIDWLL